MWRSTKRSVAFQSASTWLNHSSPTPLLSKGILGTVSRYPTCLFCLRGKNSSKLGLQWIKNPVLANNWRLRTWSGNRYCNYVTSASLEEEKKGEVVGDSLKVENNQKQGTSDIMDSASTEPVLKPNLATEEEEKAIENVDPSTKKQVTKGRKSETGSRFRVLFDEIEVGREYMGKVRKVTNYGAFIDIGCFTDGLLHVSQMSDTFVNDPTEIVKVGDELKVRVVNKKPEKKEFSLSIRPPKAIKKREEQQVVTPTTDMENNNNNNNSENESSKARGRSSISRLQRMGIPSTSFAETADDSTSATSRVGSNIRKPRASATKGSPSMRASFRKLARETDEQKFIKGTVVSITEFGAFVDFGGPSDGLIHISEVSEDWLEKDESGNRKINLSVGDEVQIRVIDVDVNRSRVSLSMKPFAISAKKQLQEDLAAANESQPEFESVLALALRRALQEKEAELATKSRH